MRLLIALILFSAVACGKAPEGVAILKLQKHNRCSFTESPGLWFFSADVFGNRDAYNVTMGPLGNPKASQLLPVRDGFFRIEELGECPMQLSLWDIEPTETGFTATLDSRPMTPGENCSCRDAVQVDATFHGRWIRHF